MLKIILILTILIPSLPSKAKISNRAIFKINDKIIWRSQINKYLKYLEFARCVKPNSSLIKVLSIEERESIPHSWEEIFEQKNYDLYTWSKRLVQLIKLDIYFEPLQILPLKQINDNNCNKRFDKKALEFISKFDSFVQNKYSENDMPMMKFFKILLAQQEHEFIFSFGSTK